MCAPAELSRHQFETPNRIQGARELDRDRTLQSSLDAQGPRRVKLGRAMESPPHKRLDDMPGEDPSQGRRSKIIEDRRRAGEATLPGLAPRKYDKKKRQTSRRRSWGHRGRTQSHATLSGHRARDMGHEESLRSPPCLRLVLYTDWRRVIEAAAA